MTRLPRAGRSAVPGTGDAALDLMELLVELAIRAFGVVDDLTLDGAVGNRCRDQSKVFGTSSHQLTPPAEGLFSPFRKIGNKPLITRGR